MLKSSEKHYYELRFDYPLMNDIMKIMKEENIEQVDQNFELSCSITLALRKAEVNKVLSKFDRIENLKIDYITTK